jgi:nitroreductase
MDVEEAIRRLHVVRKFSNQPVSDPDLRAILDAGRRTGSSKNLQRWHFVVVREKSTLARLSKVGPFAGHLENAVLAIALVMPDPDAADSPLSVTWDMGRAAQSMVLVAWARGLGSVPATVYEHDLCRTILGYPPDMHCEYILNIGHPAAANTTERPLRKGGRKSLDEVAFAERWGRPFR